MDRKCLRVPWFVCVLALMVGSQAFGDILNSSFQPSRTVAGEEDSFPESRFGSAPHPGHPDASGDHFDAMSNAYPEDAPVGHGNRSPASGSISGDGTGLVPESTSPIKFSSLKRGGVQEVALIAGDLGFFPKTLFVTRNVPVKLFVTGASKKPLCIMMDSFEIRRQVRSQKIEEIDFTPSAPGQFRFYCPVNGMEGTLLVRELTTVTHTMASEMQDSNQDSKPMDSKSMDSKSMDSKPMGGKPMGSKSMGSLPPVDTIKGD